MSVSDDIVEGLRCMDCYQFLISASGEVCQAGYPVHCRKCWKKLPKRDRDFGAPYFDRASGEILTGDAHAS